MVGHVILVVVGVTGWACVLRFIVIPLIREVSRPR